MRIQRRITLGIGILFTMILLLGIQSVSYVRQLSRATGTILADNYNSLQYAGEMLRSLNDIGQDSISRHALRENLALQQGRKSAGPVLLPRQRSKPAGAFFEVEHFPAQLRAG